MKVTACELSARCGEYIDRAAGGEEIVITKHGVIKARMVPALPFDSRKQGRVFENIARIRARLAREGKRFSRQQIKAAIGH